MTKNKDRWSSLSMKDRAGLIKVYVSNGITNINTIKSHYNKFDEGGEKHTTIIPKGNPLKDLAYLIGSDSRVSSKGYATFEDLKRIFNEEYSPDNPLDDNKLLYIYGNIMGLYPSENSNGKDYSNYLRKTYPLKTLLGKIKEYEGTINPYNEYVIDERDRGLIEELAKRGKGIYSNADTEYSYMADMYDENMPYRDDVSGYHAQFVNTPNGPAISASDLYDFGPDYNPNKYVGDAETIEKLLGKVEALALGFVGNPYVLRQDNVPIRFINMNDDEYGEEWQRAQGFKEGIERGMLSEADRKAGITIDEKLADILGYGYIEPVVVTAERKKKQGGKLNKFVTGGPIEQNVDSNWLKSFKELPDGYKKAVLQLVTDLNYDVKDAESLYNSGKLKAVIEAKYQNTPSGRERQNDSPTSTESSNLEKKMNKRLYNSADRVLPNMKYAIPYVEELEVKVPGVGRTTTNALDSLAKYAIQAQIPLSEALGLSAQETAFGALPQYNYVEIVGTEEEKQKARDFNRTLGNSSYFRNYGIIPAENFVRDFRYNIVEDPIDRDVPPLLHAFNYWKKGNYNRGDSNHTKDVKAKGEAVMKTKVIQDWINNSKFAQEALNLSK